MSTPTELTKDWRIERRDRRLEQAVLPSPLRRIVRSVRRDDLARALLSAIDDRVFTIARERGLVQVERRVGDPDRTYVRRCDEHAILIELAARPDIVGWLRRDAQTMLRAEHTARLEPSITPTVAERTRFHWSVEGDVLVVASDAGLGSARYLEGEPDGWALWVADQLTGSLVDPRPRVSVVGAGVGGIVRALTVTGLRKFRVEECDWIRSEPTALNARFAVRRGQDALEPGHDAVVLVFPSCATPAASQHRRIYVPDGVASAVEDPSRLGRKKWLRSLSGYLALAMQAVRPDRRGYFLIPTSVRDAQGYLSDPQLAADVEDIVVATTGLRVVEKKCVEEVSPVRWPFVGTARSNRFSFIIEREPF